MIPDPPPPPNYERRLAVSQRAPEFRPAEVKAAVQRLAGCRAPGEPVFLPGGLGNENWQIDTGQGPWVCKIGPADAPLAKWRSAAIGAALALAAGLPAPRPVAFEESCAELGGRPVRLFEMIEGCSLDSPGGLLAAPPRLWAELGAAVRRLHRLSLPSFSSRLNRSVPAFPRWDLYLAYRTPHLLERVRASGYLAVDLAARFLAAAQSGASRIGPAIRPALTHRDLHPDNLLVSPSGGLAAILDWDQAEAWDPVADFFKLNWLIFEEAPQAWPVFAAAYGFPEQVHAYFDLRLDIVCAFELVSMLAGCTPDETLAIERIRQRLQALARKTGWPDPTSQPGVPG